jgi:protein-S-isoprenylcysteine O-methyltransferase Ste14
MTKQPWNVVFLVGFIVYLGIRAVYKRRTKCNERAHRRWHSVDNLLLVTVISGSFVLPLLYLFSPWLAWADYRLPELAPWIGAVVMLGALWLFWRSHADLGLNWSQSLELRKGHTLIQHGVYRRTRHPMYASIWLWSLAQGLLLANWLAGWFSFVAFAVLYFVRTPREEVMMCEAFGEEYRAYMRRTGRLFPRRGEPS